MRTMMLVFSLGVGRQEHGGDSWFGPDKLQHFFTSAFVQSFGYAALRRSGVEHPAALAGASVVTAAAGVGKELRDRRAYGEFSVRDLAWDVAGAGSATVLLVRTQR
jgi:putative lipoprotein